MNLKIVGNSLAGLSIALGVVELVAGKSLARRMGVPGSSRMIRAFGARELLSGAALLRKPTSSYHAWGRVAGDVLDLWALAAAFRAPGARKQVLWGGVAFVSGALIADALAGAAMRRAEKHAEV